LSAVRLQTGEGLPGRTRKDYFPTPLNIRPINLILLMSYLVNVTYNTVINCILTPWARVLGS